jgi:hypothetical protein
MIWAILSGALANTIVTCCCFPTASYLFNVALTTFYINICFPFSRSFFLLSQLPATSSNWSLRRLDREHNAICRCYRVMCPDAWFHNHWPCSARYCSWWPEVVEILSQRLIIFQARLPNDECNNNPRSSKNIAVKAYKMIGVEMQESILNRPFHAFAEWVFQLYRAPSTEPRVYNFCIRSTYSVLRTG